MSIPSCPPSCFCQPCCLWSLLLLVVLVGCSIDDELPECDYNARIDFFYTLNGEPNSLPLYIRHLTDYVFNANDTLIEIHQREQQKGASYAGLTLPPGHYSVVSWGNAKDAVAVMPAQIGHSRLDEMMLYLNNRADGSRQAASYANADKLYYGCCEVDVPIEGIGRARIDMTHSHCRLGITVKWKRGAPPDTQQYHMELSDVAGSYRFTAKHEIPNPYLPAGYAPGFYAIPEEGSLRVNHRVDVEMGITRTVHGEFVTLRLTDDDHPVFRLYANGKSLLKDIDLHKYFTTMQIGLSRNLRQEFDLVMEVQPDGTVIVSSAKVSDWQEGESIGSGV